MKLPQQLTAQIEAHTKSPFVIKDSRSAPGGCINQSMLVSDGHTTFFVKLNSPDKLPMFTGEALGLAELHKAGAMRVPQVIAYGNDAGYAWIILEKIDFAAATPQSPQKAGELLAKLHFCRANEFGWQHENTIGSTPQINTPGNDWSEFWKTTRLGVQIKFAQQNGYRGRVVDVTEKLIDGCHCLLGHKPAASLLHGDLWSGNLAYDSNGEPVIYDPAVYYGDCETDLAMTELFGGFSNSFYSAYKNSMPLDSGYSVRKRLYNLYHILNHMNMFGGGYESQAIAMAESLLAEIS